MSKNKMTKRQKAEMVQGFVFVAPSIMIVSVFIGISALFVLYLSFNKVNLIKDSYEFVGFSNYTRAATDALLWTALKNTLIFSVIVVPIQTFLALVVAAVLNSKLQFKRIFRTVLFMPTLTSSAALTMIFMFICSVRGPINGFLINMGFLNEGINFLQEPKYSLAVIMAMNIWSTVPMFMTLYLASLQELPVALYEAAGIDGATAVQKFFKITIPYLRPITTYVLLVGVIGTLQMFDQAYIFSNGSGGPANSTLTISLLVYRYAFGSLNAMGYAAVIAMALMVIILIISLVVNRINKEERIY